MLHYTLTKVEAHIHYANHAALTPLMIETSLSLYVISNWVFCLCVEIQVDLVFNCTIIMSKINLLSPFCLYLPLTPISLTISPPLWPV